jgi:hypothetical protein
MNPIVGMEPHEGFNIQCIPIMKTMIGSPLHGLHEGGYSAFRYDRSGTSPRITYMDRLTPIPMLGYLMHYTLYP